MNTSENLDGSRASHSSAPALPDAAGLHPEDTRTAASPEPRRTGKRAAIPGNTPPSASEASGARADAGAEGNAKHPSDMTADRPATAADRDPAIQATGVDSDAHVETAGAFDIRMFIGALIGLYGAVLLVLGLFFFDAAASQKTDGMNANLWAGIIMLAFAIAMAVWAKLDPIRMVVRDNEEGAEVEKDIAAL